MKRLVADLTLDRQILQDIVSKRSCKASPGAPFGEVDARSVSGIGAAGSTCRQHRREHSALLQPAAFAGSVAHSHAGISGNVRAIRLSPVTVLLRREGWKVNHRRLTTLCSLGSLLHDNRRYLDMSNLVMPPPDISGC